MAVFGALITCIVAVMSYVMLQHRGRDHSQSAARVLVILALVFAAVTVVGVFLRDEYWSLYGIMQPPEGAGLRAKLTLARGISVSAPFVATMVAGFAATRKVRWALVALVVLLLFDGWFALALVSALASGMLG